MSWHKTVMHQLILLRHAKAMPAASGASDHDRPLAAAGKRAATGIGTAMRQAGLAADVVLVSTALRTQQTLDALEACQLWDERPNIDTLPALYMATSQQITEMLRDLPETVRSAIVIGHNPGLQDLAQSLAGTNFPRPELQRITEDYPTASLAEFLITTPWRKLGPGAAALQRYLRPSDLPA
jgi:phosphohistidine phosphatase